MMRCRKPLLWCRFLANRQKSRMMSLQIYALGGCIACIPALLYRLMLRSIAITGIATSHFEHVLQSAVIQEFVLAFRR